MKTTVEIPEGLFGDLKRMCVEQGITLKDMLTAMVTKIVVEQRSSWVKGEGFRLRQASYAGGTSRDGVDLSDWAAVRRSIYTGRGE